MDPGGQRYILIVEDSPDDLALLLRALGKVAPDVQTLVAGDADQALELLHDLNATNGGTAKLALVDIGLPGMGGLELVERLRKDEAMVSMPIVVLTGSDHRLDMEMSRRLGADGYIQKPIDYDEMLSALQGLKPYLF